MEETIDRCKQDFNTICDRHGAVVCKKNRVDIVSRLSTMDERDRQTDRQTDHRNNTDRNRRNRFSAMSPKNTTRPATQREMSYSKLRHPGTNG